jgi:hypothetical protein
MKILRALGLVTAVVGAASWLDARSTRLRAQRRDREAIEKTRWESEGGATPSGPHLSETMPGQAGTTSSTTGMATPG